MSAFTKPVARTAAAVTASAFIAGGVFAASLPAYAEPPVLSGQQLMATQADPVFAVPTYVPGTGFVFSGKNYKPGQEFTWSVSGAKYAGGAVLIADKNGTVSGVYDPDGTGTARPGSYHIVVTATGGNTVHNFNLRVGTPKVWADGLSVSAATVNREGLAIRGSGFDIAKDVLVSVVANNGDTMDTWAKLDGNGNFQVQAGKDSGVAFHAGTYTASVKEAGTVLGTLRFTVTGASSTTQPSSNTAGGSSQADGSSQSGESSQTANPSPAGAAPRATTGATTKPSVEPGGTSNTAGAPGASKTPGVSKTSAPSTTLGASRTAVARQAADDDNLAHTGASGLGLMVGGVVVLIAAGGVALYMQRRRRA